MYAKTTLVVEYPREGWRAHLRGGDGIDAGEICRTNVRSIHGNLADCYV